MKIRNISLKDAENFCQRQEDHFFDRKAFALKPAKLQKVATAFANSDGGEIAIGIDDRDTGRGAATSRWNGPSAIEQFNQHIQALTEIAPSLPFSFTFLASIGLSGFVLFVQIEKSAFVHKTSDGHVYIRKSAQSLPLRPERILELTYAKGASSFEDQTVKSARIEDMVDGKEIHRFLADYSPATDPIEFSLNQHLVDVKSWEPKVAGILLFANSPSALMPKQCAIKIARYETKEDEPERDHLKETVSIEGPLYEQIHLTISKLQEMMSSVAIWTTEGLRTVQYPPEAIWEIIVNAVIHRDYSISDNIHIHVFNNRIEVLSPGKLPGYVTVENILDSRYSRNPKIVRALSRYKEAPNKDMGEGLNTAFQKMKEWKLKSPLIREEGNYVQITIPHSPLATPEEAVLEFLVKNGTIRNSQAREITGIRSENEVKRVFIRLTKDERIERVPGLRGSASLWRLKK